MSNIEGKKITFEQEVDEGLATFNLREFLDVNELALDPVPLEKILFTGLDDSGKTSIILAIQRELSLISLLKPTRHAQRKIFQYMDRKISEWDLGGQKRYRIAYIREPSKYFAGTSVCIYTIDMQDKRRIQESLSYLGDVVEQFKKLGITPTIYIFFHKLDPDYVKEQGVHLTGFISELKDTIRKIVKEEFSAVFMQTSIYDLWTIINAFSRILLGLYPQSELLDKTITQFVEKVHAKGSLVLDSNSLVIGQHFEDENIQRILQNSTAYFLTLAESLTRTDQAFREMNITRGNYVFFIGEFKIPKSPEPLYIILMKEKNQPEFSAEEFEAFVKMLQAIL